MSLQVTKTVDGPIPGKYVTVDLIPGTAFFIGFKLSSTPDNWKEILDKIKTLEDLSRFANEYHQIALIVPVNQDKQKVLQRLSTSIQI
jgi:hypothetical protein